jgi:hypothetical protein
VLGPTIGPCRLGGAPRGVKSHFLKMVLGSVMPVRVEFFSGHEYSVQIEKSGKEVKQRTC